MAKVYDMKQNPQIESVLSQFPDLMKGKQPIIIMLNQTPSAGKRRSPNFKRIKAKARSIWDDASKVLAALVVLYIIYILS